MNEWLELDSKSLSHPGKKKVGGAMIDIVLSPYDIPEAVRSFYDQSEDIWVIEFRYISEHEPLKEQAKKEGLVLRIGKHSGRLYRIEVAGVSAAGRVRVYEPKIERAITELAGNQKQWRVLQNYHLAKEILAANKDNLLPNKVAAAASQGQ